MPLIPVLYNLSEQYNYCDNNVYLCIIFDIEVLRYKSYFPVLNCLIELTGLEKTLYPLSEDEITLVEIHH